MKLEIEIPTAAISFKEIHIVNSEPDETRKGLKAELEKKHRRYLRKYKPFWIPICCEWCHYIGEKMWHCHNPESSHYCLNVSPWAVCSHWRLNQGLAMYLHHEWWNVNYSLPKTTVLPNGER